MLAPGQEFPFLGTGHRGGGWLGPCRDPAVQRGEQCSTDGAVIYESQRVLIGRDPAAQRAAGAPVLFLRSCDAEEYARSEDEPWLGAARIIPVRVGSA